VTNDVRFYPRRVPRVDDSRITYVDALHHLVTLGRAARKKNLNREGLAEAKAPTSFNLRSITRSLGSVEKAIMVLRARSMAGMSGNCTPNIDEQGNVLAGETRFCFRIGTVDSTTAEVTRALVEMRCNECGLVDNLTQPQKRAIGESLLFAGTEP
jgi:hypothetical protein